MKKYQIILISVFAALVLLILIGRLTNGLQYYSVPTRSNEPTFKTGSHFLGSNLKTPQRFDFICYISASTIPEYNNQTFFHRICGMPGDTVEIRNGDLFVNGISCDGSFNLRKRYVIPNHLANSLDFEEGEVMPEGKDSVVVPLETIIQKDLIQKAKRYLENREDPTIHSIYGQQWTPDHFGPYIVPANTYFVMGDNRNFSMDSRFSGPVDKTHYLTTVLGK